MNRPEILAPGGSPESIYSAINAGCDAIYAGGKRFGARAFADNQDNESLMRIMDDIHIAGKKLYLTVNTILTETEMGQLYDYLVPLYENGLDAVIVQDMGVLKFINDNLPELNIHASTQLSITGGIAANLLKQYGVTRIVPARELSLDELASMRKDTDAEIEVFVHGALCSSYSGQCLMSSLIGGRSGNRGACAQPCRKMYSLNGAVPEFVLSLKDLCTIEYIPELIRCGVDSYKIEGRMKKPEYTALVTHMYRKYVDMYYDIGEEAYKDMIENSGEYRKDIRELKDVYNRGGFTAGYLTDNVTGKTMLSGKRPNHEGVKVGRVNSIKGNNKITIKYTDMVNKGDILEIRDGNGVKIHDYTMGCIMNPGNIHNINSGYNYKKIREGMAVYRTRNNALIERILSEYPVTMKGIKISGSLKAQYNKALELSVAKEGTEDIYTVYGDDVRDAKKHAADEDYIKSKVMVSGDSGYVWSAFDIDMDSGIYLSPSELKDIRRRAFAGYREYCLGRYRRKAVKEHTSKDNEGDNIHYHKLNYDITPKTGCSGIIAEFYDTEQLKYVIDRWSNMDNISSVYIHVRPVDMQNPGHISDITEIIPVPYYIVLPRIIRKDSLYNEYMKMIRMLADKDNDEMNRHFEGIVVCTLEQLAAYRERCKESGLRLITGDNMYVRNSYAADWYVENGAYGVMASVEAADAELDYMDKNLSCNMSVLIYGKPAAMITAWTPGDAGILKDAYNNSYKVINMREYNELINYEPIDRMIKTGLYNRLAKRVVFTDEEYDDIINILMCCAKASE